MRFRKRSAGFPLNVGFDVADDPLGFLVASVNEQPAWAFRDVAPDQQHEDSEDGADAEREPPSDVGREVRRVQQHQGAGRSGGRSQPVGPVDDQIHATAHPRGDQLVDR